VRAKEEEGRDIYIHVCRQRERADVREKERGIGGREGRWKDEGREGW